MRIRIPPDDLIGLLVLPPMVFAFCQAFLPVPLAVVIALAFGCRAAPHTLRAGIDLLRRRRPRDAPTRRCVPVDIPDTDNPP